MEPTSVCHPDHRFPRRIKPDRLEYKPTLLLAENVTHGASKSAEIYIIRGGGASAMTSGLGQPSSRRHPSRSHSHHTIRRLGGVETTTGITLPVRWTGYANQMRIHGG